MDTSTATRPSDLHVGKGRSEGGLTIFPVWTGAPVLGHIAMGSDAGLQIGEQQNGPAVERLAITNAGQHLVLLVEGELLEGGWQHRVVARDTVLRPGQRRDVAVACVEQGRWNGSSAHGRRARRSPVNVTAALREGSPGRQGRVWASVAQFEGVRMSSPTGSLLDHLDADRGSATTAALAWTPLEGQRGVIIGIGGIPASLELFPSAHALAAHWEGIVAGAVLAAELAPHRATPGQAARDLAVLVESLPLQRRASSSGAHRVRGNGRNVSLRGIGFDQGLAHATALVQDHPMLAA